MTVRLAVFDLDGTLLHTGSRITPEAAAHVAALVADGLPVALASARLDASMAIVNEAIGVPLDRISYNGALVTLADGGVAREVGFEVTEAMAEALAAFTEQGTIDVYCSDGRWLVFGQDEAIAREEHDTWCTADEHAPHAVASELAGLRVRKVMCEGSEELMAPLYALVAGLDDVNLTYSGMGLHDIWTVESGKGNGLRALCAARGITLDEVLAVGDSVTDLPMITIAGQSIGVCPGAPEVATHATRMVDGAGSDTLFAAVREMAGLPPRP